MRRYPRAMLTWLALIVPALLLARFSALADGFEFGPHPRLATPRGDETSVTQARKYMAEGLEVPEEAGQWTFYYSCPEHATALVKREEGHTCPTCGKVYDDERTRLAYITSLHYRLDKAAWALAQAWRVAGEEEFARAAWQILSRYAELTPDWQRHDRWGRFGMMAVIGGKRYAQSLDDAIGIIDLARAYDLIYDWKGIEDDARERVERRLFRETIDSIYSMYRLYSSKDNHMSWRNAAAAIVGVVIGEEGYIERALNGGKGFRWQMVNSVTTEGLWYEGTLSYHFYALGAINDTLEAAQAAGAGVEAELAQREKMYLAPPRLAYPDGRMPAINDSDPMSFKGYKRQYQKVAEFSQDKLIRAIAAGDPLPQLPSEVLEDAGLAYMRQWGERPLMAILDFGQHGGAHGHPDKMNLLLFARGRELFPDIGRLTYRIPEHRSWAKQSVAHNTVVLGHRSQTADTGSVIAFGVGERGDYVVGESRGAYSGAILRRALVVLPGEIVVDIFRVEQSGRPRVADWVLHGTVPYTIEGVGKTNLVKRPPASGDGYQHIDFISETRPNANLKLVWRINERERFATWLLHDGQSRETLYQGTGIGYSLSQRLPLVIRSRRGAKVEIFAAVHAPDEGDAAAWSLKLRDGACIVEGNGKKIVWEGGGEGKVLKF